jgi:hypothetical protein
MATTDRSYIGKGPVYFKVKGAAGGMQAIGNCSNLEVSFEEESVTLSDYTTASGGNRNSVSRVSTVTGSVTMHDFSAENLALALRGAVASTTAGAVTAEAHGTAGTAGEFIPFDFIRDAAASVTVTDGAGTTYVEGVDYDLENNGITLKTGTSIDDQGIEVDYTKSVSETMEALTDAGQEYEIYFNGLNEAQSGSLVEIRMYRVKFSPAQGLSFIGDEFGELTTEFEILSDTSKSGAGISKFMKVAQAV